MNIFSLDNEPRYNYPSEDPEVIFLICFIHDSSGVQIFIFDGFSVEVVVCSSG